MKLGGTKRQSENESRIQFFGGNMLGSKTGSLGLWMGYISAVYLGRAFTGVIHGCRENNRGT